MHMHHATPSTCKRGVFGGGVRRLMSLFEGSCRACSRFGVNYQRQTICSCVSALCQNRPFSDTHCSAFLEEQRITIASVTPILDETQNSSHNQNLQRLADRRKTCAK